MRALSTLLVVVLTAATVGSQEAPLTIIRADPSSELTRLDERLDGVVNWESTSPDVDCIQLI